jgi:hypothetical protein
MNKLAIALFATASIIVSATAAAATDDTQHTCSSMATQTRTALQSNHQSANYEQARKEDGYGRDFCDHGMQKEGLQHYAQALKLLGVMAS